MVSVAHWTWWRFSCSQVGARACTPSSSRPGLSVRVAKSARHRDIALLGTCQSQDRGTRGGWMGLCPSLFAGQRKQGSQEDKIQICSYRRFPSSCYSKTKCFTHLGSIIKYGSAGWSVVGANFLPFAERLVTRPFKRTCQNCFDCANATCKHFN